MKISSINNYQTYNKKISFGTIERIVYQPKENGGNKIRYRNNSYIFREDLDWNNLINHITRDNKPRKIYCYACSDGSEPYVSHIGKDKAWAPYSMSFTMFSTGALAPQKQEETTTAEKEKDDPTQNEVKEKDEGTTIHNDIVEGSRQDTDDDGNPLLPLVIGGVAVGGISGIIYKYVI